MRHLFRCRICSEAFGWNQDLFMDAMFAIGDLPLLPGTPVIIPGGKEMVVK